MGRIFGIALLLLALWIGLEIYTAGFEHAFGGALAGFGGETDGEGTGETPGQRAGETVRQAQEDWEARRSRLLEAE